MKKIKIGYYCADVNPKKTISLGIYKTTKEILRELLKNKSISINLILSEESSPFFKEFKCKKNICYSKNSILFNKLFVNPLFANRVAKKEGLDLLFFPKGHIPLFRDPKTKYVSIIHDLIPLKYQSLSRPHSWVIPFLLKNSARKSDLIFTDSKYSMAEIVKITSKPVRVIPLGYRKVLPKDPKISRDYVFIIGNNNKHKNLQRSIHVLEKYSSLSNKNYLPKTSSGKLSESELAGLYKCAKFCMFLSEIEGFGLPLIESYYYGTPVVFNNKTSLAEIGKGLPGACDVEKDQSIFDAIEEVLKLKKKDIQLSRELLLKKYNWKLCGSEIFKGINYLITSNSK